MTDGWIANSCYL